MLPASETWPLTKPNFQHLQRNDRAMIRQTCNVRAQDIVTTRSNELFVRLGIEDLDLQWCSQDILSHTGWGKVWAWEAQDDMEAADREGLQGVEALGYQPSWQTYLEIWCEICHACSKPATWKGAYWCGCCPCTCTLVKTLIMIWWSRAQSLSIFCCLMLLCMRKINLLGNPWHSTNITSLRSF